MTDNQDKPDPDIEALIEETLEEAPQLLRGLDAPFSLLDELLAAIQGPAVRAALEARIEQIVKYGHDREHDSMLAIAQLPRLARDMTLSAIELLGPDERRNIEVAKKRIARAIAILLAAFDRLDSLKEERSQ